MLQLVINIARLPFISVLPWILLVIVLVLFLIFYIRSANILRKKNEQLDSYKGLQERQSSIELENLESRLNPHLFKNILNSVQSHAYQTFFALDKLSGVLDYILYESRSRFVTPEEEISFALKLIEINKIKLSPLFDLRVKKKISEHELLREQKLMAPMATTVLIENAFHHADLQSKDSFISVVFELKDGIFYLTVSNSISGNVKKHSEKDGHGIDALKKRLNIIYGKHFLLESFIDEDVYISHLKLNLIEYKADLLAAR